MSQNIKKLQVVIPEKTVLFDEGDSTKEMYILLKGEVEVLKNEKPLAVINANGSFIGEMATLLDAPRTAKIQTTTKSVFLKVEPEDVDVLFKVTPELGYSLSKSLAERLAMMTEKVVEANALSGGGPRAVGSEPDEEKLDQGQIAEAEQEMEKEKGLPSNPAERINFLTRTEVHKDVMRYYFNHIGEKVEVNDIIADLGCPDMLVKIILAEFKKSSLIAIEEGVVEFKFIKEANMMIENWVFDHGLFRGVS
jgi:CRP/FNR family transcriptional regulator, cyclic AMP receptor protein